MIFTIITLILITNLVLLFYVLKDGTRIRSPELPLVLKESDRLYIVLYCLLLPIPTFVIIFNRIKYLHALRSMNKWLK